MTYSRWTRQRVLETLRQRHQRGLSVASSHNKGLYEAGRRHFGSWQATLAAAGLPPLRIARSKEQVIGALRAWFEQGVSMDQIHRRDNALYEAAGGQFGTWRRALKAAKLPYRKPNWSKARIVAALRRRHARGLPVSRAPKGDRSFRSAIYNHFGSLYQALVAAGMPGARAPRRWSRKTVVEAIRARQQQGLSLKRSHVDDLGLRQAAAVHFGTWQDALVAAGIPTKQPWSKQRVLQAIRDRYEQGLPLDNMRYEDGVLYRAAHKYCGGWNLAMQAAGLTVKFNRRWTKSCLIEAIRSSHNEGTAHEQWRLDRSFVHSAARRFGSWQKALRAAGVPCYRSTWDQSTIVAAIQQRIRDGMPLAKVWKYDNALYAAAKMHFGTWKEALSAAGLRSVRQSWTRQRVLEELRHRLQQGQSLTQLATDDALKSAAWVYYGSWGRALSAAGVDYHPPRRWSKTMILEEMQRRRQQGLTLNSSRREIWALTSAAERQFGSWSNALRAAGMEPHLFRWTKQRVIEEIQRLHGEPQGFTKHRQHHLKAVARRFFDNWAEALAEAKIIPSREQIMHTLQDHFIRGRSLEDLRRQDPGLDSAARKTFGSWKKAVRAAGLREDR
jgi:transposase